MAYVTLEGNAGKQPELKTSQNGKSYCRFSIAWSERQKPATNGLTAPPSGCPSPASAGSQKTPPPPSEKAPA